MTREESPRPSRALAAALAALAVVAALGAACGGPAPTRMPAGPDFPSAAGINYGEPRAIDGEWAGTRWLRPGTWERTRPAFDRDLGRIGEQRLGGVLRLFVGLDQLMVWDPTTGFAGFDDAALANLGEAFDMLDRHGLRALVVLYDQEEVSSAGNFHFVALDGRHAAMRAGYLRATEEFMRRFGGRSTVVAWDLFNEAYNSLGTEGGLARPPASDPVSPGYPDAVVHAWVSDLYAAAKRAAPRAWLTVSDTTELYWHRPPDPRLYDGAVDYYDIHVYDDHPRYPDWAAALRKPYIVGEAGAGVAGDHFDDQRLDPPVLRYLLDNARPAGVRLVLAQGRILREDGALTPTGEELAAFLARRPA